MVELITRQGCHLCEEAERLLRSTGRDVTVRDVDEDPELLRLYDFRVPVVLADGRLIAEGKITMAALRGLGVG